MISTHFLGLIRSESLENRLAIANELVAQRHQKKRTDATRTRIASRLRRLRAQAHRRGHLAGRRCGEQELARLIASHKTFSETIVSAQQICLEIAVGLAEEIIEADLIPDQVLLTRRIRGKIHEILRQRAPTLYVETASVPPLQSYLAALAPPGAIQVLPDDTVPRGDAVIETATGRLYVAWREDLQRMRERLFLQLSELFTQTRGD